MKITDFVKKYDPQNQFEVLKKTYGQIEFAWNNKIDISPLKNKYFDNIVVTGLGGSAISGDLMQNFLKDEFTIPYSVNRNYYLPKFAGEKTLVVVSSYSGNTEETVAVFNEALKRNCSIVCITTGGSIEKIAAENNVPVVKIFPGLQPRYALGLSFFSLLKIFQEFKIIKKQDETVNEIIKLWNEMSEELSAEDNRAYKAAQDLTGFIPVIYSAADVTSAAGYRLKCQFNENSKLHAIHNVIPELNHNEIIGWESFSGKQFNTKVISIEDEDCHPQIKKRFEITKDIIRKSGADIITLKSTKENFKLRLMELIYLGDWISYYLALLRGFDPTEIENINYLKEHLK